MTSKGLLVRLQVKGGQDADTEEFLRSALPLAQQELATTAWFAIRFGGSEYGIFDVFPGDAGRDAHLGGPVAASLVRSAGDLLDQPPAIDKLDVLAEKIPAAGSGGEITKGLLLTFKAKQGEEANVERFLRDARALVLEEPKTVAWWAIRLANGDYGIFDVFADNGGRLAHLAGHVPRELAKHSLTLLGSVPDTTLLDVLAAKL
jgi:hypothetical protein